MAKCDMRDDCKRPISYVDNKGFVYCREHGIARKLSGVPCRQLTPHQINRVEHGKTITFNR